MNNMHSNKKIQFQSFSNNMRYEFWKGPTLFYNKVDLILTLTSEKFSIDPFRSDG